MSLTHVQPPPILDYAGPVSRSALRMAARSELTVTFTEVPARLLVHERLAGRGTAVAALALAVATLFPLLLEEKQMARHWNRNVEGMALIAGIAAAEIIVGVMVINQTWRRTVLDVTTHEVSLTFTSPFGSPRRYHWPAEQLARVEVIDSAPVADVAPGRQKQVVPELELTMWSGPPVRLFIGHPQPQLNHLAGVIRRLQPPLPEKIKP